MHYNLFAELEDPNVKILQMFKIMKLSIFKHRDLICSITFLPIMNKGNQGKFVFLLFKVSIFCLKRIAGSNVCNYFS